MQHSTQPIGWRLTLLVATLVLALAGLAAVAEDASAAPIGQSPADCGLKSNDPHLTYYLQQDVIKGVAEVRCDYTVDILYVKAQLWRSRWWGWEKVGNTGQNTNYNSKLVKGSAWWNRSNCSGWHDWRTSANGWSWENGTQYTGTVTGIPIYLAC